MIFSGCEFMGIAPFSTVFIHGQVRDDQGRKMSKSLGNGVDPLDVIAQYGADALRFSLCTGNSPGNDMRYSDEKVQSSRNFANKLWNAARFVLMNLDENEPAPHIPSELAPEDKWILSRFNAAVKEVTAALEKFELGLAAGKLYDFIWDEFCDWYIELAKASLPAEKTTAVLVYVLSSTLKLLHPVMPFITEEIWRALPHEGESIMISDWPEYDEALDFPAEEARVQVLMDAIRAVRNRRAEMNVPPSRKANLYIRTEHALNGMFFVRLANASAVHFIQGDYDQSGAVQVVCDGCKIWIPMGDLVDLEAEKNRLEKELANVEKQLAGVLAKLGNESFTSKAPASVIDGARENARALTEKRDALRESLETL
jgi:valyl-tRNA synthetase